MATKTQTPTVRIALTPAEYRVLKAWCAMEGITLSEMITSYLKNALSRHKKNNSLLSVDETDNRDD